MSLRGLSIDGPERSNYVPYQAQWKLYIMHVFFAFTSRMWDMGIVFLIAELTNNSLSLVAMAGLMNNIFIILFMSRLGTFLDTTNRLRAAEIALSVKLLTLTIAYGVCAYLAHESHDPAHNSLVYLLPFLCAIASLSFSTISQSVEKDWIVVLSAGDSAWLSTTNSIMTQIDSGVNSFAPAATGYLFLTTSPTIAAIILLTINALSTLGLYFFLRNLYVSWPALAHRSSHESAVGLVDEKTVPSTSSPAPARAQCGCNWATDYADFFASGCAGAMISYACLYLTVLNFGSLMTVYLRWAGVSDGWIGLGRGAAAFTALCGAVAFPFIYVWLGLYVTSAVAIVYQCVLVTAAAASFYLFPPHITVFILVVAVLLSRAGLWMFDLGIRQIAQEHIAAHCRGKVNGQWRSLMAVFEMSSYLLALIINDPQHFYLLTTVSASMVCVAMVTYLVTRPDRLQYAVLRNDMSEEVV